MILISAFVSTAKALSKVLCLIAVSSAAHILLCTVARLCHSITVLTSGILWLLSCNGISVEGKYTSKTIVIIFRVSSGAEHCSMQLYSMWLT